MQVKNSPWIFSDNLKSQNNVNIEYIRHVLIELWSPITFEPITYLIVSIHHTVRLINLSKNNYLARLANNQFKCYGPPKLYKDMFYKPHIYVTSTISLISLFMLYHKLEKKCFIKWFQSAFSSYSSLID